MWSKSTMIYRHCRFRRRGAAVDQQQSSASPTDLDAGVVGVRLAPWWVGEQNVLRFEVPVDYSFGLKDPHGPRNLLQKHSNSVLTQSAFGWREKQGPLLKG